MTNLFFVLSLIFLWTAFNLYFPVFRYPVLNAGSFLAGWLTGELALHHLVWQVFLVLLLVSMEAVTGLTGALGLFFCIFSWLILGYFHVTGHRAETEVTMALQKNLGRTFEDEIAEEFAGRFPLSPDYRKIARPFPKLDKSQLEVIKNVEYGHYGQTLDVYKPRHTVKKAPVLLQIHGGGWTERLGSKNGQGIPLMTHMVARNWICVANSYRLSPKATFPDHIIDCKEALVWIRDHIEEYGGNPGFVMVTGGSAGGHLASLMALTANDPDFQPGFEARDTSIRGAVIFYGVYDFTNELKLQKANGLSTLLETFIMKLPYQGHGDQYRKASPLHRINEGAPPFMIIHGNKDSLVPVAEARVFAAQLRENSDMPVVYAEISGAQHAFDLFASIRSEHVKHGIEKFLAWTYSRYLADPSQ